MPQDAWAALADPFVEGAYTSVEGQVRTFVLHAQLLRHLPDPPATVLDVGGGAAHQSLPLARLGYTSPSWTRRRPCSTRRGSA